MNELHVFGGDGGGILGGILSGDVPVCAVEINERCRKVLFQRQRDGILPWFPIWDNIETFDGRPWRGIADVVSGGFPCTGLSSARTNNHVNGKQLGLDDKGSGLWHQMARVIGETQPLFVRIENSPNLRTNGLVRILQDLNRMGYDTRRGVLGCRNFGADHVRNRMFIVAHANRAQLQGRGLPSGAHQEHPNLGRVDWWKNQPGLERVANGMPDQMVRLKSIGNRQIPAVACLAWETLIVK